MATNASDGYVSSTYGDSFADVYDNWYSDLNDTDFVEALRRALSPQKAHICELGVGTARLISALAERRSPIRDVFTGIDTSEAMLKIAREKVTDTNVTYLLDDFSLNIGTGPYDLVFAGYNTLFNLANEESVRSCMRLVAESLAPHGYFFIDVARPLHGENGSFVDIRSSTSDSIVLSFSHHDLAQQGMNGQFVEDLNGRPQPPRRWAVRYMSPEQLDACATDSGLMLVNRSEDGNTDPFTRDSRRHISQYRLIS